MMFPESFPIQRMEDYHTHYIGKVSDGRQFFGYQTFVFPDGVVPSERGEHRKEYVVLYLFDKEGNHLETKHWYAGIMSVDVEVAGETRLVQMINELGNTLFCDIVVKPFQTVIDGVVFGLVPNEEYATIDLQPGSTISFQDPWDGEYYT